MDRLKKSYAVLLAPLLTAGVLLYVFRVYAMYPFGQGSLAWCDMNQQTVPLLMDFKDILAGKDGLFLNMHNGGGMNFFGVFWFFLSSPFSFLAALVPKADMIRFANLLVVFKLALCAFTAAVYLHRRREKLTGLPAAALSVMYALCGYGMLFYQNVMWLDVMALFPLLVLGLERLTEQGKNLLYILTLTAVMVVNFYIGYMVAVFILLYMGLYFVTSRKNSDTFAVMAKFLSGTVIAALVTAVVWLPGLLQASASGRMVSLTESLASADFLTYYTTILPLLFCTAFVLPAAGRQAVVGNHPTAPQTNRLILLGLLLVPFVIEPINRMWHTGNYMAFPARYGFITVFMGLVCCADALLAADEAPFKGKKAVRYAAIPLCALLVAGYYAFAGNYVSANFGKLTRYTSYLWGDAASFDGLAKLFAITALCYGILYALYRKKILARQVFAVLLVAMCLLEGVSNARIYMASPSENNPGRTQTFAAIADLSDRIEDETFYRVVTDYTTADYNMVGALGYPSISHYTSFTDHDFMVAQRLLGYSTVWMKAGGNGGTELTNALYSVKYKITRGPGSGDAVYHNNTFAIERLTDPCGLGLVCDGDFADAAEIPAGLTRAQVQQYVFSRVFDTDEPLILDYDYQPETSDGIEVVGSRYFISNGAKISYRIHVAGRQSLYADCYDRFSNDLSEEYFNSLKIEVNGVTVRSEYPGDDQNGLLHLGEFEDETVTVTMRAGKAINCYSFGVFGLDLDLLARHIAGAQEAGLRQEGGTLRGTVNTQQAKTCFLAVPYNEGLRVKINGQQVPCRKVLSDFTAFDLQPGENQIQIYLIPKGFVPGLLITLLGVLALILYRVFGLKRRPGQTTVLVLGALAAAGALAGFLLIYVFPLLMVIV